MIGNKDVVEGDMMKETFQPFNKVTMVLSELEMRRDGEIQQIGLVIAAKLCS